MTTKTKERQYMDFLLTEDQLDFKKATIEFAGRELNIGAKQREKNRENHAERPVGGSFDDVFPREVFVCHGALRRNDAPGNLRSVPGIPRSAIAEHAPSLRYVR